MTTTTAVRRYDAVLHAQAFDDRVGGEGKHTLHFIEEADHNFKGHQEEVNATIVEWLERLEQQEKKGSRECEGEKEGGLRVKFTGIWRSRVRRPIESPSPSSASISKL
ncbi:hypothetical protein FRC18_011640 [Serendipita sp. 400]|nr:hypothetical protein FRC18_011640 [Serendipita sp. 400]